MKGRIALEVSSVVKQQTRVLERMKMLKTRQAPIGPSVNMGLVIMEGTQTASPKFRLYSSGLPRLLSFWARNNPVLPFLRKVADVWEKDVWEFQAKSGSSGSCRLFLHFLGKIAVRKMSGRTPGSPRHPSSRHPRPADSLFFFFFKKKKKGQVHHQKKQGFFIPTEPLKSLEKKGKTLKKTRNSSQGQKKGIPKKQKEGQGRHVKIGHVKIDRAHFRVHFREHWKISREHCRGVLRGDPVVRFTQKS